MNLTKVYSFLHMIYAAHDIYMFWLYYKFESTSFNTCTIGIGFSEIRLVLYDCDVLYECSKERMENSVWCIKVYEERKQTFEFSSLFYILKKAHTFYKHA